MSESACRGGCLLLLLLGGVSAPERGVCSGGCLLWGMSALGVSAPGVCSRGVSAPGGSAPRGGGSLQGGVCSLAVFPSGAGICSRGCLLLGGWYPSMHWGRQPPVNRITDTSKNITLATTSLRPVISKIYILLNQPESCSGSLDQFPILLLNGLLKGLFPRFWIRYWNLPHHLR